MLWSPIHATFSVTAIIGIGLIPMAIYAWGLPGNVGPAVFSLALLLGLAALLAGGLIGFLFGVPRKLQEARPANELGYAGNTNLEQISDWLTKILVGVGLTQILQIPGQLQRLTGFLAPGLGNQSSSQVFALSLLGYFSVGGFLIGYLSTRLLLARAFVQADLTSVDKVESSIQVTTTKSLEQQS
jgi:hypothetical protein